MSYKLEITTPMSWGERLDLFNNSVFAHIRNLATERYYKLNAKGDILDGVPLLTFNEAIMMHRKSIIELILTYEIQRGLLFPPTQQEWEEYQKETRELLKAENTGELDMSNQQIPPIPQPFPGFQQPQQQPQQQQPQPQQPQYTQQPPSVGFPPPIPPPNQPPASIHAASGIPPQQPPPAEVEKPKRRSRKKADSPPPPSAIPSPIPPPMAAPQQYAFQPSNTPPPPQMSPPPAEQQPYAFQPPAPITLPQNTMPQSPSLGELEKSIEDLKSRIMSLQQDIGKILIGLHHIYVTNPQLSSNTKDVINVNQFKEFLSTYDPR